MNKNEFILERHYGKQATSHCDLNAGKSLKSLWFEIPEYCHLYCDYCFASTNSDSNRNHLTKRNSSNYLDWEKYEDLLREFAGLGGEFIGIPGKGEPFHPLNIELTKKILLLAKELKLKTTIFTTGETIFFKPTYSGKNELSLYVEPDYSLVKFLEDKDVILLIKFNSENEEIQDKIVHTKNYTKLRARAIDLLEENGFNQGNKPKLGIVTSILKDNYNEILPLYEKYHLEKGFIFDCDTILPRGRGEKYYNREDNLTYKELNDIFKKLKEKGAILTCQGGTYVGVACDRILHHLYVSLTGDVYPCIGCFENYSKDSFLLGNIKHQTIKALWYNPKRVKLRENTREAFTGVCYNCQNFEDNTCYSCLGRCVSKVDSNDHDIIIDTHGCSNHRPQTIPWINSANDYVRTILSIDKTTSILKSNFENLWKPNQNIAFVLNQLTSRNKTEEIYKIINSKDAQNFSYYNPGEAFRKVPVQKFSSKKQYRYSDLDFPLNKIWDFLEFPLDEKDLTVLDTDQKVKIIDVLSKSFLSNIFLPSIKLLFDKYDQDNNLLLCNLLFYDNQNNKYFYRTVVKNEIENDNRLFDLSLILFRWAEDIDEANYFSNTSKGRIFNLSSVFRNELYRDYELVLNDNKIQSNNNQNSNILFLNSLINCQIVKDKTEKLEKYLSEKLSNESSDWYNIKEHFNSHIFNDLDESGKANIVVFYEKLNEIVFFKDNQVDTSNRNFIHSIKEFLKENCKKVYHNIINDCNSIQEIKNVLLLSDNFRQKHKAIWDLFILLTEGDCASAINYIIFLRYLREVFYVNNYMLTHSTNFKASSLNKGELLSDESVFEEVTQPSGILLCSKKSLCRELKSEINIVLSNILQPFDEFYYKNNLQNVKLYDEVQYYQHSLDNISTKVLNGIYFLGKSIDSNLSNKMIATDFNNLAVAFKIYDISRRGISRKSYNLNEYPELNDLVSIINLITNYFNDEKFNDIPLIGANIYFTDYTPKNKLRAFTIFFNLIKNAVNYSNNQNISITFNSTNQIAISNATCMKEEYVQFINGLTNKYPTGEKSRGLVVVKTMIKKLNWQIEAISDFDETKVIIIF